MYQSPRFDSAILKEIPANSTPRTTLHNAKKLGNYLGFKTLYFKLEGQNITGTYKDRAAIRLVEDATFKKYQGITVGTCGNFGKSIAYYAKKQKLNCRIFIPEQYQNAKKLFIYDKYTKITFTTGTYETAVETSNKFAKQNKFYNANPQDAAGKIAIQGYAEIASEITAQASEPICSLWISVGNGTGLAGIYSFYKNKRSIPLLFATSSYNNNAIIESIQVNKSVELTPTSLHETDINEPLLNWRSFQVQEVLEAVRISGGSGIGISDEDMVISAQMLKTFENISTTPASACALAGLIKMRHLLDRSKSHIVVLTS